VSRALLARKRQCAASPNMQQIAKSCRSWFLSRLYYLSISCDNHRRSWLHHYSNHYNTDPVNTNKL